MTEAEWLAFDQADQLWRYPSVQMWLTRRKAALFGAACVRATDGTGKQRRLWKAVEAVERAVDTGDWAEVARVHRAADAACGKVRQRSTTHFWALAAMWLTGEGTSWPFHAPGELIAASSATARRSAGRLRRSYADILRDIVGNPFRPVAFDPAWRTDTVVSLTKGMYESRDFSPMPILADALQDAGCDSEPILSHCRDETLTHVRGCWAVDLILGKS
jgi:hypothetical protein